MNFNESLKILNIEEYGGRIFNSNSHGELFHLEQYICFAEHAEKTNGFAKWFSSWFNHTVELAQNQWERPESIYQHIGTILKQYHDETKKQ